MDTGEIPRSDAWPTARFPSRGQMQEFLGRVELWNRVEGLPRIETARLADGVRLRFFSLDPRKESVLRLIDAFGGFVVPRERRSA